MTNSDSFLTIQPKSELIRKHISYYYFHQSFNPNFQKSFVFFPNFIHGITAYTKSSINFKENSIVTPCEENELTIFYTMNYSRNIKVTLNGVFNKIGICFHPAGLNYFVNGALSTIYDEETHRFNYYDNQFNKTLLEVYKKESLEEKRDLLDQFFESKYVEFKHPELIHCLNDIIDSNGTIKVDELSERYAIHPKTLLRQFNKHFGCSIEAYKKMVKFRNTLNFTQSQQQFSSLTEISLYNHYYDQADFNKQFKAITNFTPKELLSKIEKMGEEKTYWVFE